MTIGNPDHSDTLGENCDFGTFGFDTFKNNTFESVSVDDDRCPPPK